jgi:hypothetical protein
MVPFFGGMLAFPLGVVGTVIEAGQWLFRGELGSAFTALVAGGVSTAVNTLSSGGGSLGEFGVKGIGAAWWGNVASGAVSGATLGTHARAGTEALIGAISGALGSKPQVLRSYPAAIGSINAGAMPQGPGKFAAGVSSQRGEDANAAYSRYTNGEGGAHINELQSANGRGA